jgi:replicative DNA helicase
VSDGFQPPTAAEVAAMFDAAGDYDPALPDQSPAADERAVLGSAIQGSNAAADALAVLRPDHFGTNVHRVVFEAVQRLADAGQPVGLTTVMSDLAGEGMLARVGDHDMGTGGVYLHSLAQHAGPVGYHAPKVLAAARKRGIQAALRACAAIALADGYDPDTHPDEIRKRIEDATALAGPPALRSNSEAVYELLAGLDDAVSPGLPTGYADLDEAIGGLRAPDLVVIAGRPGQGKSLIGLCIADNVGTRLGLPVLFASLEMTEEQLTQRRVAAVAKVPLTNIVRHQATDGDWERIRRARDRLTATALHVDDTPSASVAHIRGRLHAMARAGNPARLLVIDYLGFMAAPKAESRQQAVADLARQCKNALAREFGIPVILLCQLNRLVETRADKLPALADLRESGEIEQSADIVILLHREDAYEPESPRAGEIDLLIRKNRQGPLCTMTLCFQGWYGRIVSMAPEDSDPDNWTPSSALGAQA